MQMEKQDFQFADSLSEDEKLTLPHFDDEETIQSARPVVPLHEVRKTSRTRQRWLLGAALVLAAVIGAVAASLIYDSAGAPAQGSITAASDAVPAKSPDFVTPTGEAGGTTVNSDETVALESKAIITAVEKEPTEVHQPAPIRTKTRHNETEKVVRQPQVEDREVEDISEQQWRRQQRREARQLRRQRRAAQSAPTDDLTRIREIFEGSPRP